MNATSKASGVMPFERNQMLDSFTVAQLRDIAFTSKLDQKQVSAAKNKAELLTLLTHASAPLKVLTVAHRYEAVLPYKHLFLFACNHRNPIPAEIAKSLRDRFYEAFESFSSPHKITDEFHLEVGVLDIERGKLFLKFVHFVDIVEWKTDDDVNYRKHKAKKRHQIVLTLHLSEGLAAVSFPGYTQGAAIDKEQRLPYSTVVSRLANLVSSEEFGISLEALPTKNALEYLLQQYPEEVSNASRTIKQAGNGLSVNAGDPASDVTSTFLRLFPGLTAEQVKEALKDTEASSMLILWKKSGIFTRINLKDNQTDILFIWKREGASSVLVDKVLRRIDEGIKISGIPRLSEAQDAIKNMHGGDLIQASFLAQRYSLSPKESRLILLSAVNAGLLELRFRVQTDSVSVGFANSWRTSLQEIPASVELEDDVFLDTKDPRNVDIAYERTKIS